MSAATHYPLAIDLQLPWQEDEAQREKFKRTLKRFLIPLLFLFIVIPWLPAPEIEYEERELDIVKTKIVLEPVVIEPEATPVPVRPKLKPKLKPKPLQKKPAKPKSAAQKAKDKKKKEVAEQAGVQALAEQLSSLQQLDFTALNKKNVSTSQGGEIARADSTVLGEDKLTQKSTGIKITDDLMKSENVALAAHTTTTQDGFIDDGAPVSDSENYYSDLSSIRSVESIRRVIEAGKSRANLYYQRALRENESLAGVFVFEMTIEPDGKVSKLNVVSSERLAPDLEKKILEVIRALDFGTEEVSAQKVQYKFNFVPS